jgi:hypothetical protein
MTRIDGNMRPPKLHAIGLVTIRQGVLTAQAIWFRNFFSNARIFVSAVGRLWPYVANRLPMRPWDKKTPEAA